MTSLTIDSHPVSVAPGETVLDASRRLGLDIPTLCYLEKCGPLNSCQVCLVKINGKLVPSCGTKAQEGMAVESETNEVHEARRTALELLFSDHVGDCLAPCNRLCPLRLNIPVMIRHIQAGNLDQAATTVRDALPLASVLGRLCHHPCEQGCRRGAWDQPAAIRDMEHLVADYGLRSPAPHSALRTPHSHHSVAIVGAGPTGLTAAHYLLRQGHSCTIADRHGIAGGTLRREMDRGALPKDIFAAELKQLEQLDVQFRLGAALGQDVTVEGLLRGFDVVLLAVGEITKAEGEALGLEMVPGGIKINPDSMQTQRPAVFAAGRAVRPVNHLVRAMSDGQTAAECIHQFLSGKTIRRLDKPPSSIMGRLDKDELKQFLASVSPAERRSPCDACVGFSPQEGGPEAARCLHCDCRSSGDCALQSYAQIYGADPSRFRASRRRFEQYLQPSGIIFEPGKCIACGICVKLTELAREPLGLTFIGRGFDVRIGVPFNRTIEEGLRTVAEECVQHCPTGALVFREAVTANAVSG
jgi:ferredoxin